MINNNLMYYFWNCTLQNSSAKYSIVHIISLHSNLQL